ncbi:MAG: hypothetical protein KIH69_002045 [Anaerolineae bacterium]|nr:hypothetical protein [Anaerolineae bacterium]
MNLSSQLTDWQAVGGWYGGTVFDLAVSVAPNAPWALAATLAGVYRSTDGAKTWALMRAGFSDDSAVRVLAAAGNTIFAATQNKRLFQSDDGGQTWREMSAWTGVGVVNAIAIAPNFAANGTLFVATDNGVYRSFDRGESWELGDFGMTDSEILCLAVAPNFDHSELIWAGSASGAFYRSPNGARAWRETGEGLTDSAVQCLVVSPDFGRDKTLFVGQESGGVFVSRNAGQTWQSLGLQAHMVHCLQWVNDGQHDYLWAGTDDGVFVAPVAKLGKQASHIEWQHYLASENPVMALAGPNLVGLWEEGCLAWGNGEWAAANVGLAAQIPPQVLQLPNGRIYALSNQSLARSDDGGQTWQTVMRQSSDDEHNQLANLTALKCGDEYGVVLASQSRLEYFDVLGVYNDQGHTPQPPMLAGAQRQIGCIAKQPNVSEALAVVYVSKELHVSADAGKTWRSAPGPDDDGTPLQAEITHDGAIHIVTYIAKNEEDADGDLIEDEIRFVGRVWRWESTNGSLPQSSNDWTLLSTLNGLHVPLVSLVSGHDALLIGAQNSLTRVLRDAEGQLRADAFTLEEGMNVTGLARSPHFDRDHRLVVATNRGVLASVDEGQSWQPYGDALAGRSVVGLLTQGAALGAVTLGGAVWRV